jgi:hypothetical protein
MSEGTAVQYLVLSDSTNPYLLARVRWPDVAQAISAGRPDWLDDIGLFDLPTDPSSTPVTLSQAKEIALAWGAQLHSDATVPAPGPSLIRRMPANWSNLTPAEKRAWSLDLTSARRRAGRAGVGARLRLAVSGSRRSPPQPPLSFRGLSPQPAELEPQMWDTGAPTQRPPTQTSPTQTSPTQTSTGEEASDPAIESIPAIVVKAAADAVTGDGRRLPAVFSRMRAGPHPETMNGGPTSESQICS